MRLIASLTLTIIAIAITAQSAWGATEADIEKLREYFNQLGTVHFERYAPLSSPDHPVGGAVIAEGERGTLHIARVDGNHCTELFSLPVAQLSSKPVFRFLLTGVHVMIYATSDWTGLDGVVHQRGDMLIYDLVSEGSPKVVFELKDACDLTFQAGGALSTAHLISQPARHFLNGIGKLPVKHTYCWLTYNPATNTYELSQHLTALPNAATVDAANLNNRAIVRYHEGRLLEASNLLAQADSVADADQSIIAGNQNLVNSEMDDLGIQGDKFPDRGYDEALEYFWQGNFLGVLRVMDTRGQYGYADYEAAIFGLALAQENRWIDSDKFTTELQRQQPPFLADYYWELAKIAYNQSHGDGSDPHCRIGDARLLAIEGIDRQHPGYIVGLSRLLRRTGEVNQGEQVLEQYVFNLANETRSLSEPRLELYGLYTQRGNFQGCDRLKADAMRGPLLDLLGYVMLEDYIDYSTAMIDIPLDSSGRIKAPEKPLEVFDVN